MIICADDFGISEAVSEGILELLSQKRLTAVSCMLNFNENIVTIYDNVIYEGANGSIVTENVLINLLTKDVEIYMNDKKDKVEVNSKN